MILFYKRVIYDVSDMFIVNELTNVELELDFLVLD